MESVNFYQPTRLHFPEDCNLLGTIVWPPHKNNTSLAYVVLNPLKPNGYYMYHLPYSLCPHIVCVSCGFRSGQP